MRSCLPYRLIFQGNTSQAQALALIKDAERLFGICENMDRTLGGLDTMTRRLRFDGYEYQFFSHGDNDRIIAIRVTGEEEEDTDACEIRIDSGILDAWELYPDKLTYNDPVTICPQGLISQTGSDFLDAWLKTLRVEYLFDSDESLTILQESLETGDCYVSTQAFDEQENTRNGIKRSALFYCPPSLYTGKLRSAVSAWYGSNNQSLTWNVSIPDTYATGATLYFDNAPLGSSYTHTTAIYKSEIDGTINYYLLYISNTTVGATKIIFSKCGEYLKNLLGTGQGIPGIDNDLIELFILASAEELEGVSYYDSISVSFDYAPLAYGWHVTPDGSTAKTVHVYQRLTEDEKHMQFTTAVGTISISIDADNVVSASYSVDSASDFRPRRDGDYIIITTTQGDNTHFLNFNFPFPTHTDDGDGGPLYVIYNENYQGGGFKVISYTREEITPGTVEIVQEYNSAYNISTNPTWCSVASDERITRTYTSGGNYSFADVSIKNSFSSKTKTKIVVNGSGILIEGGEQTSGVGYDFCPPNSKWLKPIADVGANAYWREVSTKNINAYNYTYSEVDYGRMALIIPSASCDSVYLSKREIHTEGRVVNYARTGDVMSFGNFYFCVASGGVCVGAGELFFSSDIAWRLNDVVDLSLTTAEPDDSQNTDIVSADMYYWGGSQNALTNDEDWYDFLDIPPLVGGSDEGPYIMQASGNQTSIWYDGGYTNDGDYLSSGVHDRIIGIS